MTTLDGLWWLLLLIGPQLVLQRWLHREIQAVFLLLTRRAELALVLFSLLFFPGVLLHEASHYLTAFLLGVRVGGISLIPQVLPKTNTKNGKSCPPSIRLCPNCPDGYYPGCADRGSPASFWRSLCSLCRFGQAWL